MNFFQDIFHEDAAVGPRDEMFLLCANDSSTFGTKFQLNSNYDKNAREALQHRNVCYSSCRESTDLILAIVASLARHNEVIPLIPQRLICWCNFWNSINTQLRNSHHALGRVSKLKWNFLPTRTQQNRFSASIFVFSRNVCQSHVIITQSSTSHHRQIIFNQKCFQLTQQLRPCEWTFSFCRNNIFLDTYISKDIHIHGWDNVYKWTEYPCGYTWPICSTYLPQSPEGGRVQYRKVKPFFLAVNVFSAECHFAWNLLGCWGKKSFGCQLTQRAHRCLRGEDIVPAVPGLLLVCGSSSNQTYAVLHVTCSRGATMVECVGLDCHAIYHCWHMVDLTQAPKLKSGDIGCPKTGQLEE